MLASLLLGLLWLSGPAEPSSEPRLVVDAGMHTASISRIAVDAAERYLVSASHDKTVRVWSLPEGTLLDTLRPPIGEGDEGKLYAVAISPDGRQVVCGGRTADDALYVFDRRTGTMQRPVHDLPNVILHLAYSRDGRFLVVCLGGSNGIRVYRTHDFSMVKADSDYGSDSYWADFAADGSLVTSSYDGDLRLYNPRFELVARKKAPGGQRPFGVAFSPDGQSVAVGFGDSSAINLLSANNLSLQKTVDTRMATNGNLGSVCWSADGQWLYAAGTFDKKGENPILTWTGNGSGTGRLLPGSQTTVMQLWPARAGGVWIGSQDPAWGLLDGTGRLSLFGKPATADFRGDLKHFRLDRTGQSVGFGFEPWGKRPARFELSARRLTLDPSDQQGLIARTEAPGLEISDWRYTYEPKLAGKVLPLEDYETSRSLAIHPRDSGFLLGTEWCLRYFGRDGQPEWQKSAPGAAWAVNISGDGRLAAAVFGDGTIRWFRIEDGVELLAFFPHRDGRRWVAWTPSGYYDASPGGEALIGWHVNRGADRAADFYPAARFRETYYRPELLRHILAEADEERALAAAGEVERARKAAQEIARKRPPKLFITAPDDGVRLTQNTVTLHFRVESPEDAPVTEILPRIDGRPTEQLRRRAFEATAKGTSHSITVPVPEQNCTVSLIAVNRHGQSDPARLRVVWAGKPPTVSLKPDLFLLAVGVSTYDDASLGLTYPAKDARDFAAALESQRGGLYNKVRVKLLTDTSVDRDGLLDGLEWLEKNTSSRDVAAIFVAGHAAKDNNGRLYYLPADVDKDRLKRTAVPWDEFQYTLEKVAGKALLFMDACHSGAFGTGRRAPDMNSVINELTRVERAVIVFASSTSDQYSLEDSRWNNGAFTKALVEGLSGKAAHDGVVTINTLDAYVARRVRDLTGGNQQPTTTKPPNTPDIPIALIR